MLNKFLNTKNLFGLFKKLSFFYLKKNFCKNNLFDFLLKLNFL